MPVRRLPRDLWVLSVVVVWIGLGAGTDHGAGIWRQRMVGAITWAILVWLLRGESRRVRAQVAVVIMFATMVEYTASPLLGFYTYRLHNVPSYVPPGHGLVYLAALCIGRSWLAGRYRRVFTIGALAACGAWAAWGMTLAPRQDLLGAIMFLFLARFILIGRQPLVYAGAFIVCTYLELVGTHAGAWAWAQHGPGGYVSQGNPPSGIPGGYCFFDAAGMWFAPSVLNALERLPALLPWRPQVELAQMELGLEHDAG
jgi:hypothetical protein